MLRGLFCWLPPSRGIFEGTFGTRIPSMSRRKHIRFGVGSERGPRSSVWQVIVHKSEVYFQVVPLGGVLKVSLHESGQYQLSFDANYIQRKKAEGKWPSILPRHMYRWPRPTEIGPGITLAFRIFIPTSELRLMKPRAPKPIIWIAPPPIGYWIEIAILFIAPGKKLSGWPGQRAMQTELLRQELLPNGQTLSLVYRRELVPPEWEVRINRLKSSMRKNLAGIDWRDSALRTFILGDHPDGSRFLIDVAMDAGTEKETQVEGVAGPPGIVAAGVFIKAKKK